MAHGTAKWFTVEMAEGLRDPLPCRQAEFAFTPGPYRPL